MSTHKLALAMLLATAFSSSAHADSVTIYGVADVGVSVGQFGAGKQVNVTSGAEDGSRIGFKGSEDLGQGFKAIFTLESRIELDTGSQSNGYLSNGLNAQLFRGLPAPVVAALTPAIGRPATAVNSSNALFDRQAFVGLITPVGAVLMGRQYSPAYEVAHGGDVFESGSAGSWINLAFVNGSGVSPSIALRISNALMYRIEKNGFIASVLYAPEATGSLGVSKRARAANMIYRANGLDVGVGYAAEENQLGAPSLKTWVAAGSYKLGETKLFAGYLRGKNDNPAIAGIIAPAVGQTIAGIVGQNARVDGSVVTVGAQYPVGPGRIKAGLAHYRNNLTVDAGANLASLGYDYILSPRTNLYAQVTHVHNQANLQTGIGGSGYIGGSTAYPGASARVLQVGIRQMF
jgi:predicted porin